MRLYSRFFAIATIGTIALLPLLLLPAMVGVLVDDGGLTETQAGWLSAVGALGGAGVSFMMALRMHCIQPRRLAAIMLLLATGLDGISAFIVGPDAAFYGVRILSGLATTAAYVIVIAAFARFEQYERGYGMFVTLQFLVSGIGLYLLPVFSSNMGAKGMYLILAACNAGAFALAAALPSTGSAKPQAAENPKSELRFLLSLATLAAILGFGIFEMANNVQFTYVERYGVSIGLVGEEIGFSLLIGSLVGIPGAFAIVLLGDRFGTVVPLGFGIGMGVLGLVFLSLGPSYSGYFIGSCCLGFSWAFCLPFIQSLLAGLDREGSVLAAGSTASMLGAAIGPGLAAAVLGEGNYRAVFAVAIFLFVLSFAAFLVSRTRASAAAKTMVTT
ncbi:MAG: MFS transporter [Pseudomonadota bacterium]